MPDQPAPDTAKVSNGSSRATTDDLYDALGRISAGIDLRKGEMAKDRAACVGKQRDLLAKRKLAEQSGDTGTFDELTAEIDQIDQQLRLIDHSLGEDDGSIRQPEHEDGERERDERDSDSDAGGDGDERPLAGQDPDRDGLGRLGDADAGERRPGGDDPGAVHGDADGATDPRQR